MLCVVAALIGIVGGPVFCDSISVRDLRVDLILAGMAVAHFCIVLPMCWVTATAGLPWKKLHRVAWAVLADYVVECLWNLPPPGRLSQLRCTTQPSVYRILKFHESFFECCGPGSSSRILFLKVGGFTAGAFALFCRALRALASRTCTTFQAQKGGSWCGPGGSDRGLCASRSSHGHRLVRIRHVCP